MKRLSQGVLRGCAGLVIVVVLLAIMLGFFPAFSHGHFLSPDETANFTFARAWVEHNRLAVSAQTSDLRVVTAHPRSMLIRGTDWVPVSFLAFPFFLGLVAKNVGSDVIPFLPAILFVLSAIAVWRIVAWYLDRSAADMAALLYVAHPVILFYATRTLWHNGTFIYLLLIAWGAFIVSTARKSYAWFAMGALLYSAGVAVRPSEVVWAVIFAIGILVSLRPLARRTWLLLIVAPTIVLAGLLWLQVNTYGSALTVGYVQQSGTDAATVDTLGIFFDRVRLLVFPFGIHIVQSVQLFLVFTATFTALPTAVGLLGLVTALRQRSKLRPVAVGASVVIVWLILSYGSFAFTETFTRSQIGLGSSYLRYWLPGLTLLVLFTPLGLRWLRTHGVLGPLGARLLIATAIILGLQSWLVDLEFGVVKAARRDLADLSAARAELLAAVPPDGVVAAGTLDKAFFPERRVIGYSTLTQTQADQFVLLLQRGVPLYFTSSVADDIRLVERTFKKAGYELSYLRTLTGGARLYTTVRVEGEGT